MRTWTEEKNARRCELIDKEISICGLTDDECEELYRLQCQMLVHRRQIAPLPIEEAKITLKEAKKSECDGGGKA